MYLMNIVFCYVFCLMSYGRMVYRWYRTVWDIMRYAYSIAILLCTTVLCYNVENCAIICCTLMFCVNCTQYSTVQYSAVLYVDSVAYFKYEHLIIKAFLFSFPSF